MMKYSIDLATIFSNLNLPQIMSIIKNFNLEEIKLFNSEILPQISPVSHRNAIRKQLAIQVLSEQEAVKSKVDTSLLIYEKTIRTIFAQEIEVVFLKQATKKQLFFLLAALNKNEQNKSLVSSIQAELDTSGDWQTDYLSYWKKQQTIPDPPLWEEIVHNLKRANQELAATKMKEAPKTQESAIVRFFKWLKSKWDALWIYLFPKTSAAPQPRVDSDEPPYNLELSEEEDSTYKAMSTSGRNYAENFTGKSIFGDLKRSISERELSAKSRFGIALSSQVMASAETDNHGQLRTIAASLVEPEDSDTTARIIRTAVSSEDKDSLFNLNATHVFAKGGDDALVTALEMQDIQTITSNPALLSPTGLSFSQEELQKINKYKANSDRSRQLNYAISDFANSQGGYDINAAIEDHQPYKAKTAPKEFLEVLRTPQNLKFNET